MTLIEAVAELIHLGALFALVFLVLAACTVEAAPIDMDLLRDVAIRQQESGGHPGCPDGADGEIGCWQVKLGTARQVGFTGGRGELYRYNSAWASEILRRCARRHRWAAQPLLAIAQCYGGGFGAPVGKGGAKFAYAQQVAHRYYAAVLGAERLVAER